MDHLPFSTTAAHVDAVRQAAEAERRYWYDAEFHARVETVVQVLGDQLDAKTPGARLNPADLSLARLVASIALVLAEQAMSAGA